MQSSFYFLCTSIVTFFFKKVNKKTKIDKKIINVNFKSEFQIVYINMEINFTQS